MILVGRRLGAQGGRSDQRSHSSPSARGTRCRRHALSRSTTLQQTVADATGVLLASPEYHGGISSPMKLAIDNLGFPGKLSGKPVALLGVAAGAIGAIKSLKQLRGICSHVGALVLPTAVSVALMQKAFDAEGNCLDEATESRIRGAASGLVDCIRSAICPRVTLESQAREL